MENKIICNFFGDISLNDEYIDLYRNKINPFGAIKNTFKDSDFNIGNLECLAQGNDGVNILKKPRLLTTTACLSLINNIPIHIATLAHNHVYDHLESGLQNSIDFLDENNISHLGAHTKNDHIKSLVIEKNNIKLGLINAVDLDTNLKMPSSAKINVNILEEKSIINDIKELKAKVDFVILLLHWGGRVENGFLPDWKQPLMARKFIDAGADLIIGHHSHTIQPFEKYKGKYIFYSLGNFCFSPIYFENKITYLRSINKRGLVPQICFSKHSYKITNLFLANNTNNNISITKYPKIKRILQQLIYKLFFINKINWSIYFFYHKYINSFVFFLIQSEMPPKEKFFRLFNSLLKKLKCKFISNIK